MNAKHPDPNNNQMKNSTLYPRLVLLICGGAILLASLAIKLRIGSIDPASVKMWLAAKPVWFHLGLFGAFLAVAVLMLDAQGRLFAAVARRFWKDGANSPRREALFRLAFLATFAGGMALWPILAPGAFPKPSNWWTWPCLLGAAFVPVVAALRALCCARRAVPAGNGKQPVQR